MTVEVLKQREGAHGDMVWYDLAVTVGGQRYWVDALRRKKDGFVSVFKIVKEGGARATTRRSQRGRDIIDAVREHLSREHNPMGEGRDTTTDLVQRLKF